MTDNPDQIREEIERTRGELSSDVDELADKVRPSSVAHRQSEKIKGGIRNVRERVMGSVESAGESASSAVESASEVPQRAVQSARGNPLAVGLIAFGAGWLAASLLPSSGAERELADQAKRKAEPLAQAAADAARESGENLKQDAQEGAAAIRESASESAETVRAEGESSASDVKNRADEARSNVQSS